MELSFDTRYSYTVRGIVYLIISVSNCFVYMLWRIRKSFIYNIYDNDFPKFWNILGLRNDESSGAVLIKVVQDMTEIRSLILRFIAFF